MSLKIDSVTPIYGDTYKKGYVGFTFYNTSVTSEGIAFMTRWACMSEVKVSHALIVTGDNKCIEAHIKEGVKESDLSKYFNDKQCQIFFVNLLG